MKKVIVDIFEQVWDEQGFHPIKDNFLCTVCYESDKDITELSYELRNEIFKHKGDGLYVKINAVDDLVFIRIELVFDRKHDYIIEYFNAIGKEIDYPIIEYDQLEQNLVIIENFDEELVHDLITELSKQKNTKKVIESIKMFEKGAGDWRIELILNLLTGVSAGVFTKWIMDWLKQKKADYSRTTIVSDLNIEVVLMKASELSGINKNDLLIIDIEYNDYDDLKHVCITSRYADISVQVNASDVILDYKFDQKTQTKV